MAKQNRQTDLQNLPACAAQYIEQVIRKMRYRRKVRADVQAELAAHFEDELKECKTQAEKEQKAEQLIAGFGDAKLLAVLLRRAQKRCRPLWRTIVARTFQIIGVLIICFIVYLVWFFTGKPVIETNYVAEFNRIVRPAADESMNAAQLYLEAVELDKEVSDEFLLFFAENYKVIINEKNQNRIEVLASKINEYFPKRDDFEQRIEGIDDEVSGVISELLGRKYNELTVGQKDIIQRWVQEHNDGLELVVEGSRKPHYWRTYDSGTEHPDEMTGVLVPDLRRFRYLARTLRFRAWLNAEQGQYEKAFDDLKACYRLGQHIRGDKILVEQLVGIAIEALSVQTIRDIVGRFEIDSAILAELQRSFEQIIAEEDFTISFKIEKLCLYDEIQRCFTSDRFGKGHVYLPRLRRLREMAGGYNGGPKDIIVEAFTSARLLFGHPNKEETLKTVNEFYDYYEKLRLKSAFQMHAEDKGKERNFEELFRGNFFLEAMTPALWRVIEISHRLPVDVEGTLTLIAILRYKADNGQYPQSLNQLVSAGYLKELPIDTYSDKPLVYKKTKDNFILYTIGPNFKDDGGVSGKDTKGQDRPWRDNGDTVFWPVPKSNVKD